MGSRYRFSGVMILSRSANCVWAFGSTGLCLTLLLAGWTARKLSPFQFSTGLIGLGTNPPPQLEQTLPKSFSTQAAQNVHSNEQIRASNESGGRATLQCSHVGLSSSIAPSFRQLTRQVAAQARSRIMRIALELFNRLLSNQLERFLENRRRVRGFEERPEDVVHNGCMGGKVDLKLFERDRPIISVIAHADGAAL